MFCCLRFISLEILLFLCLTLTAYSQKAAYDGPVSYSAPDGDNVILSGDCTDYIDLSGQPLPISTIGSTSGATNDYGPFSKWPDCWSQSSWYAGSGAAPDVTYKWTAPSTGRYSISLCGSGYDTVLLLFDFTCPSEPVYPDDFICGNDDYDYCLYNLHSELSYVPLTAGQEVLIVVDGYAGGDGQFHLAISEVQTDPLDQFIENMMDTYPIPGIAACVVKDGEILWTGSYGWAYIDEVEVADATIFSLASISKPVAATAFLQAWEDGLIDLDNDVNDYLEFDVRNPDYPEEIITPRMLLTHTSSIRGYNILQYIGPGDSPIPLCEFLESYLVPGGSRYSPNNYSDYAPGEYYMYSGVGFSLAACLIESVADSFPVFSRDRIFQPLEMNETAWFLADFEDTMDIAMPYDLVGYNYIPYGHYGQPYYPAAQLRSSTLQMARFLIAIMQEGEIDGVRILESSTVEMMNTVQFPGIPGVGHPGESGLGWFEIQLFDRTLWGHLGRWWGATTCMFYSPQENTGVLVFTNEDAHGNGNSDDFPDANTIIMYELFEFASGLSPCDYVIGDYNNSGAFNVADIVDGYSRLKTGLPEPGAECECPPGSGEVWAVAMDVNNSCAFNVADIVDGYSKLKTGSPELEPCEDCPPLDWGPGPDREVQRMTMQILKSNGDLMLKE